MTRYGFLWMALWLVGGSSTAASSWSLRIERILDPAGTELLQVTCRSRCQVEHYLGSRLIAKKEVSPQRLTQAKEEFLASRYLSGKSARPDLKWKIVNGKEVSEGGFGPEDPVERPESVKPILRLEERVTRALDAP